MYPVTDGQDLYQEYTYNTLNQLVKYEAGDNFATYSYRPDGLRYSKNSNDTITYFGWQGDNIVTEFNGNGVIKNNYTRGVDLVKNNNNYYLFDGHNDTVQLTDTTSKVTKNYEYDAFGNEKGKTYSDTNPFRYCGEYYDTETGYIYLRARYYDPTIGSFVTEDPAFDGVNWYSYCEGNPVRFVDPSGKSTEKDKKNLSKSQVDKIDECENTHKEAEGRHDYVLMNKMHREVNKIRYSYDKDIYKNDCYDYTHDGELIELGSYSCFPDVFGNKISGNIYMMKGRMDMVFYDQQSIGENDYICVNWIYDEADRLVSNPNIIILDSYRADNPTIMAVSNVLMSYANKNLPEWQRTYSSVVNEWQFHNFGTYVTKPLEKLPIKKDNNPYYHAKDVDLDNADEAFYKLFG